MMAQDGVNTPPGVVEIQVWTSAYPIFEPHFTSFPSLFE
jgi:hypothetical protein